MILGVPEIINTNFWQVRSQEAAETIDKISDTLSKWKTFANEVKVLPKLRDEINATLISL